MDDNLFYRLALPHLPRLLTQGDRQPLSPTWGCWQRDFWHYRTLTDFPSAPYQQAVLSLAEAWSAEVPGSPWYHQSSLLTAIEGGIRFWCAIQRKDGSFDEWYPHEESFVATAFTACAMAETLRLLPEAAWKGYRDQVLRAHDGVLVEDEHAAVDVARRVLRDLGHQRAAVDVGLHAHVCGPADGHAPRPDRHRLLVHRLGRARPEGQARRNVMKA